MTEPLRQSITHLDWTREEWRPVLGAEGFYEVSSLGRVRSLPRAGQRRFVKGGLLAICIGNGYPRVGLQCKQVNRRTAVHVLVCEAFHGPRPSPAHDVRHLNGVKTDNRAENLAWGTKSENARDTVRYGGNPHANQTHCKRGHPLFGENLYVRPTGHRNCRECTRQAQRRGYAA